MSHSREALLEAALTELDALMSFRRRAICNQPLHRGVSMPQIYILIMLLERGPTTVSELASLLSISAPSASSIVDRMEEHGLVIRERDEVDRRIVHVAISAKGRSVVDDTMGMRQDFTVRMLESMSDEDLHHVVRAVEAVRRVLGTDGESGKGRTGAIVPEESRGPDDRFAHPVLAPESMPAAGRPPATSA
jgi:DNA-binding MarR family transcriptional regulator